MRIPARYSPRSYQQAVFAAHAAGFRYILAMWHRRAGKDKTFLSLMIQEMAKIPGVYYYAYPTLAQARKVLWDSIDDQGNRFISEFPPEMIKGKPSESEMQIITHSGGGKESIFQLVGTDGKNVDRLMSSNPRAVVFSEYALQDPRGFDYVSPILRQNKGWAGFPYTPRGANHGADLYYAAIADPTNWWVSKLDITMTRRDSEGEDGSPVITDEDIEFERRRGMSEEKIATEYYVDLDAPVPGSYFGDAIRAAIADKRIGMFPWERDLPVYTCWDLGVDDETVIWWFQFRHGMFRWIDYYANRSKGAEHYFGIIKNAPADMNDKYSYEQHFGPGDLAVRDWSVGTEAKSRAEVMRSLNGGKPFFVIVPTKPGALSGLDADDIQAVRSAIGKSLFHEPRIKHGLNSLKSYQREYDDEKRTFVHRPLHNWAEHATSAFRMGVKGIRDYRGVNVQIRAETSFEIFGESNRSAEFQTDAET